MSAAPAAAPRGEAALAARWAAGLRGPLRLEDGRTLRIVFPGVPGGGAGPDFRGAILDAGGDLLRGDVEIHLRASGWRDHGHARDPAYANVVLHAVALNDSGAAATLQGGARAIAILVLPPAGGGPPGPPFTPPCAIAVRQGRDPGETLTRLGLRRMRMKAARAAPQAPAPALAGQALYTLLLETLAGAANRQAFASVARELPLAALLERAAAANERAAAITAALAAQAARHALRRAGLRPAAAPAARLECAGRLIDRLWPGGTAACWPGALAPRAGARPLAVPGVGRETAVELMINAVLPVALASGAWSAEDAEAAYQRLPAPAVYGRLRPLEGWLHAGGTSPFRKAAALQGGLLLADDYCAKGACGRCPLSDGSPA